MEIEIKNTIAARLRVGIASANRFVERLFRSVGHNVKRIDPRVEKKLAAEFALCIQDSFYFAQLLRQLDQSSFAFGGAVLEIHAGHTARHQRAHCVADADFIAVAPLAISVEWHCHGGRETAADLDKHFPAHHLAVGITQRYSDAAARALNRLEAHLFEQERA